MTLRLSSIRALSALGLISLFAACGADRKTQAGTEGALAADLAAEFLLPSSSDRQAILDATASMTLAQVHLFLTAHAGTKFAAPAAADLTLRDYLSKSGLHPIEQSSTEFLAAMTAGDVKTTARQTASVNLFLGLVGKDLAAMLGTSNESLGLTDANEANLRCFLSRPLARALQHWSTQNPRNKYDYFGSSTSAPLITLPNAGSTWNDKAAFTYRSPDAAVAVYTDPAQPSRVIGATGVTAQGVSMSQCSSNDIAQLAQNYQNTANQGDQLAAMMAGFSL